MDILSTNFEESLSLIIDSINSAEFISIDTEFTGLFNKSEEVFDEADTLEERFQKLRLSCEKYWMCQLGICTFSLDEQSNSYVIRPFNIYTLPSSANHSMSIHPSSMKFLVENNFDMNKLFRHGILCTRISESTLEYTENCSSFYKLGQKSEEIVMHYVGIVLEFVTNPEKTNLNIDVPNNYIKRLLQGEKGALKHFKNLRYEIIADENKSIMKISKVQGKEPLFTPPQKEKVNSAENDVFCSLGVTLIFAEILKKKVPIVLHNCLFDIGYLYSHFIDSLATTLDSFKNDILHIFPDIFDTKTIAKTIDVQALNRLNLQGLYQTCLHSNLFKNTVRFGLDEKFQDYLNQDKSHEAAYDAYITGICFLHLREYLKQKQAVTSLWDSVGQFKNLICLNRSTKSYLNLNFLVENNERNDNIIKFSLNSPLEIEKIAEILARFGDVCIRKISKTDFVARYDRYYDDLNVVSITSKLKETNKFLIIP